MNARQILELSQKGIEIVSYDPLAIKEDLFMHLEIIVSCILVFIWFISRK